jgi:hypothetical protein
MARLPLVVAGVVLVGGSLAWTTTLPSYAASAAAPVSGVVRITCSLGQAVSLFVRKVS